MNKELLNQFVDEIKLKYNSYLVYIETNDISDDYLVMKGISGDYEFHINSLHVKYSDKPDDLMNNVHNIFLKYYREHLLNIIL